LSTEGAASFFGSSASGRDDGRGTSVLSPESGSGTEGEREAGIGKLFTSTTGSDMKNGKNTKRLEKNGVWSLVEAGYMECNNKHRILNNHAK
jgi:hypothetical protein